MRSITSIYIIELVNDMCHDIYMMRKKAARLQEPYHRGDEPHLLREVFRTYQVLVVGFSRLTGMAASQFALLRLLVVTDANIGVMDLARQLGVNAAAITRQVQELEHERLVYRRADPKDRRRGYIKLLPKGRKLLGEIHERNHALERSLSSVLTAEEMASAAGVLTKLRTFVEGLAQKGVGP
jgi:DNA-binding MarR family transcriptional regulator